MVVHLLVLIGVLEVIGAAIGGIQTCQIEIAASLTWGFAIALDLPTFALVTRDRDVPVPLGPLSPSRTIVTVGLPFGGAVAGTRSSNCGARPRGER